jgi:DNA repair protein RadC
MKMLALHDRPRERLDRDGVAGLGDHELVALVLGQGGRAGSALELAARLLAAVGGVHGLTRVSYDELRRQPGLGAGRAAQEIAAGELGRRTLLRPAAARMPLASPRETAAYLLPRFGAGSVERFGALLLDARHRPIKTALLSVGTVDGSLVHPREVFRAASSAGAAAVVVFHNHPSGDPAPSQEDAALTWRLVQAGDLMGIDVLDHLVLADAAYYSSREAGRLRVG